MSELSFYPDGALRERAELHDDDDATAALAARVVGKVNGAVGPTPDAHPHPRLTRGRHQDELEAVEEAVDGYLGELQGLERRKQDIEAEVERMRGLYHQVISAVAIVGGFLLLVLFLVVLVLTHR